MIEVNAKVLSCDQLAAGLIRIILHAPDIAVQAKAGQFIHMLVPDAAHVLRRPISLMAFDVAARDEALRMREDLCQSLKEMGKEIK